MAFKTKLSVAFAHFPYGGNGATSSEHPDIRHWEVETALAMRSDPRIAGFTTKDFSDTPLTMTRNRAMRLARDSGADLLLMVDSDQSPNRHAGEDWFKPFWKEAFGFLYENYHKGPRLVFAPYCGPPNDETGGENVYVFQWRNRANHGSETGFSLDQYTREQATAMSGIQEAAAGPTGMILIDLRLLELIEPSGLNKREVLERVQCGQMSVEEGLWALKDGYCYYEWKDQYCDQKASTEDVTLTRDIALAGVMKLGYNPVFCAWDSWIGHHKPWNVGKPQRFTSDDVGEILRKAALESRPRNEVLIEASNICGGLGKEIEALLGSQNGHSSNGHAGNRKIFGLCPPAGEEVHDGCRVTTGRWFVHGHAPKEQQAFLADLVRSESYTRNHRLRVMEVGTWLGSTAIAMADAIQQVEVHCVDHWQGSPGDITLELAACAIREDGEDAVYKEFLNRIGDRIDKKIFPWRGTSAERATQHWEPFDIIFIDAEHTYDALKSQIIEWWPHLKNDGIMLGHDFLCHGYDGVGQAVKELFGDKHRPFGWHPQGCMWMVSKADHPDLLEKHNGKVCATSGV